MWCHASSTRVQPAPSSAIAVGLERLSATPKRESGAAFDCCAVPAVVVASDNAVANKSRMAVRRKPTIPRSDHEQDGADHTGQNADTDAAADAFAEQQRRENRREHRRRRVE